MVVLRRKGSRGEAKRGAGCTGLNELQEQTGRNGDKLDLLLCNNP